MAFVCWTPVTLLEVWCVRFIYYILSLSLSHVRLQEFNTSGSTNIDTGKAGGSLETKYKLSELGLGLNQKWNTDNTLATELSVEDQVREASQTFRLH